jgi:uncharacterized protein (TIGR03083 family)
MAKHDYDRLMWAESQDLATFLGELDDREFDRDSLCDGWRVRDVVSHMIVGHTTSMPTMLRGIARYRGNVPKGSLELSRQFGSAHTPAEIREAWSGVARDHTRRGIARVISPKEGFVDHLIHHQDIRRPLAHPRAIPAERLTAALDALTKIGGFLGSKGRMKALRWVANDIDWSWGDGPEVQGPAEALILAAGGRAASLDELTGGGVATLRERIDIA